MAIVYRLLGGFARLSERMSHTRVNGLPFNWLLLAILPGVLFGVGVDQMTDALVNGRTPRTVQLSNLLSDTRAERAYVRVRGILLPKNGFRWARKGGGRSEEDRMWVPMLDVQTRKVLLVQVKEDAHTRSIEMATITGMVRPMFKPLRKQLEEDGGVMGKVPVNLNFVLVEGARPPGLGPSAALVGVTGLVLLLFIVTWMRKYVIFQRTRGDVTGLAGTAVSTPDEAARTSLRATGRFILDEKNTARFLDTPAVIARLDSGELAIVSNVDASNYFMGVKTVDRKGLWAIVLTPGSLRDPELGRLYIGMQARPAIRLRHAGPKAGRMETSILSFPGEAERATVIAELNRAAGYELIRA